MSSLMKIALALIAAAFIGSTPVMAAGAAATEAPAGVQQKLNLEDSLKDKASQIVDKAKDKADKTAEDLKDALDSRKDKAKEQILDVQQESVTVETPRGISQETITTVTPENPANMAPATPAGK